MFEIQVSYNREIEMDKNRSFVPMLVVEINTGNKVIDTREKAYWSVKESK